MRKRDLQKRLEALERRPASAAQLCAAVVRFQETGQLPAQPRIAQLVFDYCRFLAAAEVSLVVGEDALLHALAHYLEHGELPPLEAIFGQDDGQDVDVAAPTFDWTDAAAPKPSLAAIPEAAREGVRVQILEAVRQLARLEAAADRVGLR
ncbi:MAG: hypothetical protein ACYS0K_21000 [Planctomycetota bacterium]|jgi:hypothetical protein